MAKRITEENKKLFTEARRYLIGGVNSPVRSFNYVSGDPVLVKKGSGSKVFDYDGNKYIDYVLSYGANILGHANPEVVKDIQDALKEGFSFGATNRREINLAKIIVGAIPFIEKIRFVNSGTEAVMGAVRLARGYTGRDKILKFAGSYHGHADYLLAKARSGLATLAIPSSAGVPANSIKDTLVAKYGDIEEVEKIFERSGHDIAAILVELVGGNNGVVLPDIGYLKKLRELTKRYGALLIFDEVITGFRFRFGSIAREFGIEPDLIVLGKIIGGGLPIGAYGGSSKIMDDLAPLGKVYQASTFSGNPVVMQSGISTLKILKRSTTGYERTKELTRYLTKEGGLNVNYYGNMFSMKFADKTRFKKFYRLMLDKSIYFAPSEFEANFVSLAHTKTDIENTVRAIKDALRRI